MCCNESAQCTRVTIANIFLIVALSQTNVFLHKTGLKRIQKKTIIVQLWYHESCKEFVTSARNVILIRNIIFIMSYKALLFTFHMFQEFSKNFNSWSILRSINVNFKDFFKNSYILCFFERYQRHTRTKRFHFLWRISFKPFHCNFLKPDVNLQIQFSQRTTCLGSFYLPAASIRNVLPGIFLNFLKKNTKRIMKNDFAPNYRIKKLQPLREKKGYAPSMKAIVSEMADFSGKLFRHF